MTLVARVFAVCILASTIAGVAIAAPIHYVLVGVQFDDGGTANGSFDFDPVTGRFSNVSITTTNGSTRAGATYNFVCGQDVATCNVVPPNSTQVLWLTSTAGNQTGKPAFALFFTGVTATNGLGTSDVFDVSNSSLNVGAGQEANCTDATCSLPDPTTARSTVAGYVETASGIQAYQVSYLSNLNIGDSFVNIVNNGAVSGSDPAGRICANVYVFDPNEEPVSCCSCMTTPNGLVSLSAQNDLISNRLTSTVPSSVTVSVLYSTPIGGRCDAGTVPTATNALARGGIAWSTTLHQNTASNSYAQTETPFAQGVLSPTQFAKLVNVCGFIETYASRFGLCNSCRTGGR